LCARAARRSVVRMTFRYPSFDEVRALENAARRARAKEMRRALSAIVDWFKSRPRFAHP